MISGCVCFSCRRCITTSSASCAAASLLLPLLLLLNITLSRCRMLHVRAWLHLVLFHVWSAVLFRAQRANACWARLSGQLQLCLLLVLHFVEPPIAFARHHCCSKLRDHSLLLASHRDSIERLLWPRWSNMEGCGRCSKLRFNLLATRALLWAPTWCDVRGNGVRHGCC